MANRPVICACCNITWPDHPDFLNHLAALERLRDRLEAAVYAACPHHTGIGACACCRRSAQIIREHS